MIWGAKTTKNGKNGFFFKAMRLYREKGLLILIHGSSKIKCCTEKQPQNRFYIGWFSPWYFMNFLGKLFLKKKLFYIVVCMETAVLQSKQQGRKWKIAKKCTQKHYTLKLSIEVLTYFYTDRMGYFE